MNPGRVLRNWNFARLFLAGATSIGGFSIGQVAINYLVYASTGSSVDLALTGAAFTVAVVLLSVFGGTMADRRDRRRLMILCDAVRAASLALVAAALLFLGFDLWLVLAASVILGAFSAVFQPAERAMIPSMLEKEELADANGLIQLTVALAQAFANALGGALIAAVGAVLAIGLNSVTFLASGILIATVVSVGGKGDALAEGRASFLDDLRKGVRYLIGERGLLLLTVSAGVVNLFFGMFVPFLVVYTTELLHGGALTYGTFLAILALGAVPGALLVGPSRAVRRAGLVWLLSGAVEGALILALVLFPFQAAAYVSIFVFGLTVGIANTTWLSAVQMLVPNEMQGRYFGIDQLGSFAIIPVGQVLGGLAVASLGLPETYAIAAGGFIAVSLAFFAFPELRALGYSGPATRR